MSYEQEVNDAYNDILEAGFLGKVMRITKTAHNKVNDEFTETENYTNAAMISLPVASGKVTFDNRYDEDLKKGKVRFFMVAAKGLSNPIESGDFIIGVNNEVFEVMGATPLQPSDTPILFNVGCKPSGRTDLTIPA